MNSINRLVKNRKLALDKTDFVLHRKAVSAM